MFEKILIANRGEIALRIIRACKEMGIRTVSVYSQDDADALHTKFADEAICIGPPRHANTYLNIPSIISAAEITGANAIHPGYGFLAENPSFVEICEQCNITFIGPSYGVMRMMGDKVQAREIMRSNGIPVLPGSGKEVESSEEVIGIASQIGFPVMIKASFGGGGKGMRVVYSEDELRDSLSMAQNETMAAFGNAEIYVEKYIERPKHVEFQILGDNHSNLIHLGERECTVQRRHQKLIEESPSSAIPDELRREIGTRVIEAGKEIGYNNAGTMEFLLDEQGNYYFIEMNTRIQVEHTVTEMVTNVDLIKEQIRSAAGEKLRYTQNDIVIRGHSLECRINAEDSERFIPSSGTITGMNLPGGPWVRVDTAVYSGYRVLPYYDSLIAKVIVLAENRRDSIEKMKRALDEFFIEGISSNVSLHKKILENKDFCSGNFYTDLIDRRI